MSMQHFYYGGPPQTYCDAYFFQILMFEFYSIKFESSFSSLNIRAANPKTTTPSFINVLFLFWQAEMDKTQKSDEFSVSKTLGHIPCHWQKHDNIIRLLCNFQMYIIEWSFLAKGASMPLNNIPVLFVCIHNRCKNQPNQQSNFQFLTNELKSLIFMQCDVSGYLHSFK